MKNTKDYLNKNQPHSNEDLIPRVVNNLIELPLFLASNPKELSIEIELEPEIHEEGGLQSRHVFINPWISKNSKGQHIPKYLNTTTLESCQGLFEIFGRMPLSYKEKGLIKWTRRDLITNVLGQKTGGKQTKLHDDHMRRMAYVNFGFKRSFYCKETDSTYKSLETFRILDKLKLTEKQDGQMLVLDKCEAILNPIITTNFLCGYYQPCNLTIYSSISSPIARKLYLKLDTQFSTYNRFEMTTERFFRENGIFGKKYGNPSARKQNLEQAIKHLRGKKFTSNKVIKSYKFEKTVNNQDWKIIVWAHKLQVISSPEIETESASSTREPQQKQQEVLPTLKETTRSVPLKETVTPKIPSKKSTVKPSTEDKDLKNFLDTFCSLFKQTEKEKLYRSRTVKSKVQEFINEHTLKKSLDFLHYCAELSKQNQFSMLQGAKTPSYLFSFKAGDILLITSWLDERAHKLSRERQEKEQETRRKEYSKDIFEKEKRPEYQEYITTVIMKLSPAQQEEYKIYFKEKESLMLEEKGAAYRKIYSHSKLIKEQFKVQYLIEFSKEAFPVPIPDFYEWVKMQYNEEYNRFYR